MASNTFWASELHQQLLCEADTVRPIHLRQLLKDEKRCEKMCVETDEVVLDFSREKLTANGLELLLKLAKERGVKEKMEAMFLGHKINLTENRAVLHVALRAPEGASIEVDGKNVVPEVHQVLKSIQKFSDRVRSGEWKGHTGRPLKNVICIGIGGSYLGPEFVYEAFRTNPLCAKACEGRTLRFLANVDPIDVARATQGLDPESTLVVVVSKTFTTAETMLNARSLRTWLLQSLKDPSAIGKHMVAVSTNIKLATEFGIEADNVFGFWDWVVSDEKRKCKFFVDKSVDLGLMYCRVDGFRSVPRLVAYLSRYILVFRCHAMDQHALTAPLDKNIPALMGLLSVWNSTYLGLGDVAVLPYCQALLRFTAHIQQLTMESNGKRVTLDGQTLPTAAGEVFFGEPGTNGQHSFYQLLHQGRVIPAEFIGFAKSQNPIYLEGEPVTNHDELMSNFFAQPDALALGKTAEQCAAEGVSEALIAHKTFPGDRPSLSLLFNACKPFTVGYLLSLYEHRTAIQGFVWGINSFDQWGVELGKVLAKNIRQFFQAARENRDTQTAQASFPVSTNRLLIKYLKMQRA